MMRQLAAAGARLRKTAAVDRGAAVMEDRGDVGLLNDWQEPPGPAPRAPARARLAARLARLDARLSRIDALLAAPTRRPPLRALPGGRTTPGTPPAPPARPLRALPPPL